MSITKFVFLFVAAPLLVALCLAAYTVVLLFVAVEAMFIQLKEDVNTKNTNPKKIAVIALGAAVQAGIIAWLL